MSSSGQDVPNGPRSPTTSPTLSRLAALVTLPTCRMVWTTRPSAIRTIGAHRDGGFAVAGQVEHVELAGFEAVAFLDLGIDEAQRRRW